MSGPHIHHIDPRGGRHPSTRPPKSLLILPLLAIMSITCLVFSEIEYLLPISRLLQIPTDDTLPTRVVKKDADFWWTAPLRGVSASKRPQQDTVVSSLPKYTTPQQQQDTVTSTQKTFDRIVLLGERHSGTSYTTRMLAKCFPDLDVSDFLVRYKHWFQPTPEYVVNITRQHLENSDGGAVHVNEEEDMHKILEDWPKLASLQDPKTAFNRTLVIVMFRNAYDWLEAMRLGPHHLSNHFSMYKFEDAPVQDTTDNPWYGSNYLPWQDFVQANMTLNVTTTTTTHAANQLCQNAYTAKEVSPCQVSKEYYPHQVQQDFGFDLKTMPDDLPFNAHNPIYEMNPTTGKPFEHPLELRTAKMRNLLDIPNHWNVGGFMTLLHEDVNSKGSGFLVEQVQELMGVGGKGVKAMCEPDAPKNQKGKELDGDWQNWISDNADWELEERVGYKRRPVAVIEEQPEKPAAAVEQKKSDTKSKASSKGVTHSRKSKASHSNHAASVKKSLSFDRIVLLGERHSGTSYTTRMLAKCFPGLYVSDFLVRYKHWFQPTPEYVVNVTKTFLQKKDVAVHEQEDMHKIVEDWPKLAALENPKTAFNRTLVIVMFRNVYDWLEAMRLGPHHWSNHFGMYRFKYAPVQDTIDNPWYGSKFLPWQDFLKVNMTIGNGNGFNQTHLCQNAYPFGSVSPCRMSKDLYPTEVKKDYAPDVSAAPDDLPFNAHNPIYEMNPSTGKPFENPLELRTAKIRSFMDIPNVWDVGGFMTLQHEDVNSKGSGFLLDQVSKLVGVEPSCGADPPKNQEMKQLNEDWAKWISENADWQAEGLLGYEKRDG